jgi:hypothetical protein
MAALANLTNRIKKRQQAKLTGIANARARGGQAKAIGQQQVEGGLTTLKPNNVVAGYKGKKKLVRPVRD